MFDWQITGYESNLFTEPLGKGHQNWEEDQYQPHRNPHTHICRQSQTGQERDLKNKLALYSSTKLTEDVLEWQKPQYVYSKTQQHS